MLFWLAMLGVITFFVLGFIYCNAFFSAFEHQNAAAAGVKLPKCGWMFFVALLLFFINLFVIIPRIEDAHFTQSSLVETGYKNVYNADGTLKHNRDGSLQYDSVFSNKETTKTRRGSPVMIPISLAVSAVGFGLYLYPTLKIKRFRRKWGDRFNKWP
jgi:hypothetical protein